LAISAVVNPKAKIAFQRTSSLGCKKAPIRKLTLLLAGKGLRASFKPSSPVFSRRDQTFCFK